MKLNLKFMGMPILYRALRTKKIQIEFSGKTLGELIETLVARYGKPMDRSLLDADGKMSWEVKVALNDQGCLSENRSKTILKEGDRLVFMTAG